MVRVVCRVESVTDSVSSLSKAVMTIENRLRPVINQYLLLDSKVGKMPSD